MTLPFRTLNWLFFIITAVRAIYGYITIYYNYPITIDIGISSSILSHMDDRHTLCTGR